MQPPPSGPRGLNRVSDNLQSSQVKDLIEHLSANPDEIGNMLMLAKTGSLKPRTRPKKEDRRLLPIPMGNTRLSLASRECIGECLVRFNSNVNNLVISKVLASDRDCRRELVYMAVNEDEKQGVFSHDKEEFLGAYATKYQQAGSRLDKVKLTASYRIDWEHSGVYKIRFDEAGKCSGIEHCNGESAQPSVFGGCVGI